MDDRKPQRRPAGAVLQDPLTGLGQDKARVPRKPEVREAPELAGRVAGAGNIASMFQMALAHQPRRSLLETPKAVRVAISTAKSHGARRDFRA